MSNNKTIISNTIFLYIRMLVIIVISLYTTRIVFNTLGIENYGLFNLVASFVVLFSFLNSAMQSGTQRFLNVALSSGEASKVKATFNAALNIHLAIAFLVLIVLESFGLWYLSYQLNIPSDDVATAQIIYQFSIITTVLGIISVPYQAIVVAKERMSLFAYIGIFEAIAKLFIALAITYLGSRILIVYSGLLASVALTVFMIYFIITTKQFGAETAYQLKTDKILTKEILDFSGWNLFGQIAVISSNQGVTILYNLFLGVTINAALAIAQQVRGLVGTLANNLQMAFNPQIVQSYASGDIERHNILVLNASRYSLYLISIIAIPFLLFSDTILQLWLSKNLPVYSSYFVRVIIWVTILECISGPFWMSAHAQGNIKRYQLVISIIFLLNLPLTYFSFIQTQSVFWSFMSTVLITFLALAYRIFYFFRGRNITKKPIFFYFKNIGFIITFLILIMYLYPRLISISNQFSLIVNFLLLMIVEIIFLIFLVFTCISKYERQLIYVSSKKIIANL